MVVCETKLTMKKIKSLLVKIKERVALAGIFKIRPPGVSIS